MSKHTPPAAPAFPPHTIEPDGIYFPDQVRAVLRLRANTIRREVAAGRLRVAKRAGKYYFLGIWLIEWIRGGELPCRRPQGGVQETQQRAGANRIGREGTGPGRQGKDRIGSPDPEGGQGCPNA